MSAEAEEEGNRAQLRVLRRVVQSCERDTSAYLDALRSLLAPTGSTDTTDYSTMVDMQQRRGYMTRISHEIAVLRCEEERQTALLLSQRQTELEQQLELDLLQLERVLDKERILELLEATDPEPPEAKPPDDLVPAERIQLLEARAARVEAGLQEKTQKLQTTIVSCLEERATREKTYRSDLRVTRDEVLHLEHALKKAEDSYGLTTLDLLELRYAAFKAQRAALEERASTTRLMQACKNEEHTTRNKLETKRRELVKDTNTAVHKVAEELHNQIRMTDTEMCVLLEQGEEAAAITARRKKALQEQLDIWQRKCDKVRSRNNAETEGFRRDAQELSRRYARLRKLKAVPRAGMDRFTQSSTKVGELLRRTTKETR